MGVHRGVRRVPLREAAELLGVSKDAVRQRIRRGTIRSEKGRDGRVYVYVDASVDDVHARVANDDAVLVAELRDRLRYVEGQLEAERQAHAEARRLLAAALERIPPQLEAPTERSEGPQEGAQQLWWRRVFGG